MKRLVLCALVILAGCAGTLHKPTTVGNAGVAALVAYAAAGFTAGEYLALPLCGTPVVFPCKTQAVNDKLLAADNAAYNAAKAADASGNPSAADAQIRALNDVDASTEVQTQVQLIKPKSGGTP